MRAEGQPALRYGGAAIVVRRAVQKSLDVLGRVVVGTERPRAGPGTSRGIPGGALVYGSSVNPTPVATWGFQRPAVPFPETSGRLHIPRVSSIVSPATVGTHRFFNLLSHTNGYLPARLCWQ